VTFAVEDPARSIAFWREVLGCQVVAQWPDGAYLTAGPAWIALVRGHPSAGDADYSHVALAVTVDELPAVVERLQQHGAEAWQENWTEGDSYYFTDPDGHRLELHVGNLRTRINQARSTPWEGLEIVGDVPGAVLREPSAAAALIRSHDDRVVIVEPTYTDHWNLPGGEIEIGESPLDACRREVREELGLDLPIDRLLCVDYLRVRDAFRFLFDGGRVDDGFIDRCVLPADELRSARFATVDDATALLHPQAARRVRHCLSNFDATLYLEDGEPCTP